MFFLFSLISFTTLLAQYDWQENGLPLRQGVHIEWQRSGIIASDGSMIMTWSDTRNSIRDIYAQKIDSNGNSLWAEGGSVVVDVDGRQEDPLIIPDDNGGAYIIWRDYRDENYYGDIYAQHIDSNGQQQWANGGVPLSNQTGEQSSHNLCIDGNGGAFAVWADKNGSGTYRGTHLSSDGPLTTEEGALISTHQSGGFSLEYAGNGSAVMVWSEGLSLDIFECSDDNNDEIYFDIQFECLDDDDDQIYLNIEDCEGTEDNLNCDSECQSVSINCENSCSSSCEEGTFETGDIKAGKKNLKSLKV